MEAYRVSMRARLRANGYSFLGAWAKINPWTASDDTIQKYLPLAEAASGVKAPVMPVGAFDGHRLDAFIKAVEAFLASPFGQALEQALLKLLLGIVIK